MRKTLVFVFLLHLGLAATAQVNLDSVYQEGAEWTDEYSYYHALHVVGWSGFRYHLGQDSLFNGHAYKLLYLSDAGGYYEDLNTYSISTGYSSINYALVGGIRTDSGKVYFAMTDTSYFDTIHNDHQQLINILHQHYAPGTEHLLYNFSATVGDVLNWKMGDNSVIEIDTVILPNNVQARKYLFSNYEYWIEGVGSNKGFLVGGPVTEVGFGVCYRSPYLSDYHFSGNPATYIEASCFGALTEVEQAAVQNNEIEVYPNPTNSNHVWLKGNIREVTSCEIMDMSGRCLWKGSPSSVGQMAGPGNIGTYFIKVYFKNGNYYVKRFVKM